MFNSSLIKVPIKYGVFGGLISAAIFTVLYYSRPNPILTTKGLPPEILIIPIIVFFSIKEFRDYKNGGELRLWQGLLIGFVNYSIIALISGVFITLFLMYFDTEIFRDYVNYIVINHMDDKARFIEAFDEATYERVLSDLRQTTVYNIGLDDFIRKGVIGFLSTLLITIFLRK